MKRYCFALDLVDDEVLINEYEQMHKAVWPEIINSIKDAGINNMEIYRTGNRLFMIIETADDFDEANKARMDAANKMVQNWEALMWKYQQKLPWAKEGEKWVKMQQVFKLDQ